MKSHFLPAVICCVLPLLALAQDKTKSPSAPAADDVQDLIFFGETRPVRVRLHLRNDGQPYGAAWDNYVKALFAFLDRDGNGTLDRTEAERVPRAQSLRDLLRGNLLNASSVATAPFAQLDTDPKDGKVTPAELAAYFRKFGLSAFQVNYNRVYGAGDNPLTEALFKTLDADGDGKLTRAEADAAPVVLAKLDLNEDELISEDELVPANVNPVQAQVMMAPDTSTAYLPREAPFALLEPGESSRRVVEQLLEKYDKDKNKKLSRTEMGVEAAEFDPLDADHDGQLDADELAAWLKRADIELILRVGKLQDKETAVEVVKATPAAPLRKEDDSRLVLAVPGAQIELICRAGGAGGFDATKQVVLEQFKAADTDKKGFIELKNVERGGPFVGFFRFADRDGDGKLTQKELAAFLDLQEKAVKSSAVLSLADHGRMLFDVLDANHDGRLGPRELRSAWVRVAPWDRKGEGFITRDSMPRRYELVLGQGQPNTGGPQRVAVSRGGRNLAPPTAAKGPLWFRKMDRNGDGDVSPREFLGPSDLFRQIDTDGDGLIDAQEAERYDAGLRKKETEDRRQRTGAKDL